jgi:hypothetical protein
MVLKAKKTQKILLYYYEYHIPPSEIALALKTPEKTVRNVIKRHNGPLSPDFRKDKEGWVNQYVTSLLQENQRLTEKIRELTPIIDTYKENEQIKDQLLKSEKERDQYCQELEREKQSKVEMEAVIQKKNQQMIDMKKRHENGFLKIQDVVTRGTETWRKEREEHSDQVQKLNDKVTVLENALSDSNKKISKVTDERDGYKNKVTELERDQNNTWTNYLLSFTGGAGVGIVGYMIYQKIISRLSVPQRVEPENNTRHYTIPIAGTTKTDTSGNHCSTIITQNRGTPPLACPALPLQPLDNSVTREIITGIPCIEASSNNYRDTYSGFAVNPDPPEYLQPYTSCEMAQGTSITREQSSRFYSSSHFEMEFTPQVVTPAYLPSANQIPINYYTPQFKPIPAELFQPGTYQCIPIKDMSGYQFEVFVRWALEQLGCTVTPRPKTHDEGADLDAERFVVKYVIQIKHKKEHIGTHAVMEVLYAQREYQKKYGPTKAWIISSSPFVKGLQEKHPDVEFWDLERLLTELHKHGIYYPAE